MTKVETKRIEDLIPDPNNVNKHTQKGHGMVENSIRRRGVGRGILAAGKNTEKPVIMAGNLTHEKARDAGIDEVIFVHTTGNQLVVTVRDDLDPSSAEAIALGIEDNESGKQSYNPDIDLVAAMAAGDNGILSQLKKDDKQFGDLLKGMGLKEEGGADAEPQIDRAAELLEKWKVQSGDMYQIGEHRLLCGDSTKREDVERVMGGEKADMTFIDPPYNALKSWNKDEAHGETRLDPSKWFANDNMEWDEYWAFIEKLFMSLQGHSVYVCCDFRIYDGIKAAIESAGYKTKHCIVWKKNVWGLGKRYRFQHEFIVYACKKDAPFYGGHDQSDVWELDIVKTTEHNTPKPPTLAEKAISNSSTEKAIIYDGCCGYGTTLMACQNTGRQGRGIELSPSYVAVSLERMSTAFPHLEIKKL